jgi:PTS system mannose-specific IIA component
MIGIVVVTHGEIAAGLLQTALRIAEEAPAVEAVGIGWDEDAADARGRIGEALERVRGDGGVLILTDMFGGTPSNLAFPLLEDGKVEIVTGVNLPMLLRAITARQGESLAELAHDVRERGRKAIEAASELLAEHAPAPSSESRA